VIGPTAKTVVCSGGGSAALNPYYVSTPFNGVAEKVPLTEYSLGALCYEQLPLMNGQLKTSEGECGFNLKVFHDPPECNTRKIVDKLIVDDTLVMLVDYKHPDITGFLFYADLEAVFTPTEDGEYEFGLSVNGTGKLFVNDKLVIDNKTTQRMGDSFLGVGTKEEVGTIQLNAGTAYRLTVQFGTAPTQTVSKPGGGNLGAGGFRLGCVRKFDPAEEIKEAVDVARRVDQVILCVGLSVSRCAVSHYRNANTETDRE
jgi:beta-glucosidase